MLILLIDGSERHARSRISHSSPASVLPVLLGAPQGSLLLEAPSPNGSLDGEEMEGGAGVPQASSVAEAKWVNKTKINKKQKFGNMIEFCG